jgi:dTDP-4-dehydrorhamnose reductase
MNSDKLVRAIGYQALGPWPADQRWVPDHRQWHRERPADEPRSPEFLRQVLAANPTCVEPPMATPPSPSGRGPG